MFEHGSLVSMAHNGTQQKIITAVFACLVFFSTIGKYYPIYFINIAWDGEATLLLIL